MGSNNEPKSEKPLTNSWGLGFQGGTVLGLLMMRGIYDERGGGLLLITGPPAALMV